MVRRVAESSDPLPPPRRTLNPVRYQLFRHRLASILEEGRIAMKMVSGSPVVVEVGETMTAFYAPDGTPVLVATGSFHHSIGAMDFIKKCIEWYARDPGIHEGDQFFFNDPYIGGQHLADMVIIKPVYHRGELVGWVGSIMHTGETGGVAPGGMQPFATEIFHEGVRLLGLKVVERGHLRPDVFNSIVMQVRAPHLVGLDLKARIAANNICAKQFLELVDKYGREFVRAACEEIMSESEAEARAVLRGLPDGTWRARHYGDTNGIVTKPFKVECAMTKEDDRITFDFTGSSPQNEGSINSTYPGTWGSLFVVLASQLFWNVSLSGGLLRTVRVVAPEGTVVNCRYPAATSTGVAAVGCMITQSAHECIAKLLFAGGHREDVNSGWMGGHGNPYYGGIGCDGDPVAGSILDTFAGGLGATPLRDGVHTGANMMNPMSRISDVETTELNLPILYLFRREARDSGGFGQFVGGVGGEAGYMAYRSDAMAIGIQGVGRRTPTGHGLFGGYPPSLLDPYFTLEKNLNEALNGGQVPDHREQFLAAGVAIEDVPMSIRPRPLADGEALICPWSGGGGYGDPLLRQPGMVARDVADGRTSPRAARLIFGVELAADGTADETATAGRRQRLRQERLQIARPPADLLPGTPAAGPVPAGQGAGPPSASAEATSWQIHASLNLVTEPAGGTAIRCRCCGHRLSDGGQNYKLGAVARIHDLTGLERRSVPPGEQPLVYYLEFICPGCGTLLQVDPFCPYLDEQDPVIWDLHVSFGTSKR